jgi:hypothetical protein
MTESNIAASFFPGRTREFIVVDYKPLKSRANEARKKLTVHDPIGGDSVVGMPAWIGTAYETVAKDNGKGHASRVDLDVEMKGMTIEIYATPNSARELLLTGTTIKNFHVDRVGEEEKAKFFLCYTVYTADSRQLHDWLGTHHQQSAFARFDYTQQALDLQASNDDELEDEEEPETEPEPKTYKLAAKRPRPAVN